MHTLLTVKDFAIALKVHPHTVRKMIKKNLISAIRTSNAKNAPFRIPKTEIDRLFVVRMDEVIDMLIEEKSKNETHKASD